MAVFTPFHRGGSGSPLVCLHGFLDTWRVWQLVLPTLERGHDVLALTLRGHAGERAITGEVTSTLFADSVEQAMDAAGFATARIAGNSLGGHVALQLAARGRADLVVALAPAGGWARSDDSYRELLAAQRELHSVAKAIAPQADAILAAPEGRRRATRLITENWEHIPPDLLAHQLLGIAACTDADRMIDFALEADWTIDAAAIDCPVRIVWGTEDKLLPWPSAAARYRDDWLPNADWVLLDGVGHCPQLDIPLETAHLIQWNG